MAKKKTKLGLLSDGQLLKKYPNAGLASEISVKYEGGLRLPSRIIRVNHQLNGGIPYGKILELFGEESTGKSLLAIDFAVTTQNLGGMVLWADVENGFDGVWMEKNGVDLSKMYLLENEIAIETIADWVLDTMKSVRAKLTNNEPILFVLDSLAALTTLELVGMPQMDKKSEMGIRARKIGDFLRERNMEFKKYGVCVILINQLRKKVGASKWEDPDQTPGGQATKFYASQRVGITRGKQIKTKIKGTEYKVGQNTFIRTRKDKTGPPRETTEAKVFFRKSSEGDIGFDKYNGLAELLVQKGVLERARGSSRYYHDQAMIANGEDALMAKLKEDKNLRAKLLKKSLINTVSLTRTKLASIAKNLYPVKPTKSSGETEQ